MTLSFATGNGTATTGNSGHSLFTKNRNLGTIRSDGSWLRLRMSEQP